MKNKGFKVTAIILTLVGMILTHPFLRIKAKERAITLDRVQNITGASGVFEGSQISYTYSIVSGQASNIHQLLETPVIYSFDIIINLRQPVSTALVSFTFTTPTTSNYSLNFICEHGRVTTYNQNTMTVQCLNTDVVYIKIIFSLKQIQDNYGYPTLTIIESNPNENEWVQNGYNYFKIVSASMASATQYTGEYTAKLNSILSSVDGIESLLSSIVTNTGYIDDIDTNVEQLLTVIQGISAKIDQLDNINWNLINTTYKGYTTDYQSFNTDTYGYHNAGWYVIENPNFDSSVSSGIYKLTIPLGAATTTINNIQLAQYWENNWRTFTPDSYMYYPTRNYIVLYFTVSETYHNWPQSTWPLGIYFDKQMYKYSAYSFKLEYILQSDENYWTLFNTMKQLSLLQKQNDDLQQIITILENMNINVTYQDVTNVVNEYEFNIDQVFNIENNINQDLTNQMQNFNPDNTNIMQRLNDSSILLKSVINQINGIEIFTIPLAVTLVGIVLLAIVG